MAITKEQIFETAEQITATGQNPTLAAVRKAVGGGSFTTISEAMSEWRGARQAATAPLREPAPPAIGDRLADLGADVWAIALELASGRLKADREALEGARVEMEAQKAEAVELADQMAAEIDQLRGRCADLEERARAERKETEALLGRLSAAVERAQAAEVRAGELDARTADLNRELERVHLDLIAERQEYNDAVERAQTAEVRAGKLEAEREGAEARAKELKARTNDLNHELERQQAELTRLEAGRDEASSRLIGELDALKTQVKEQTAIIRGIAGMGGLMQQGGQDGLGSVGESNQSGEARR